jgi:hypothetical protein
MPTDKMCSGYLPYAAPCIFYILYYYYIYSSGLLDLSVKYVRLSL